MPLALGFAPGFGRDIRDLMVGHLGQTRQAVVQVNVRIEAAPAAAFDDGVNDRAAFARFGGPD